MAPGGRPGPPGARQPKALRGLAALALGLAAALLLQGCGAKVTSKAPETSNEPHASRAVKPAHERDGGTTTMHIKHITSPPSTSTTTVTTTTPPKSAYIESFRAGYCPAFTYEGAEGKVTVLRTKAGEEPAVECPPDFEYQGPRIECSWVDQVCTVSDVEDIVTPEQCRLVYNLTLAGDGLKSWPKHLDPRLISNISQDMMPESAAFASGERKAEDLPTPFPRANLTCEKETFVDLDFEHTRVLAPQPPFTTATPWSKTYRNLTRQGKVEVDMKVTQAAMGLEPPGNVLMDGNSSSIGRINIERWNPSTLNFAFTESETGKPIEVKKFFLTLFDLHDGKDGLSNTVLTAAGMQEYYVSRKTQIGVKKTSNGNYVFAGGTGAIPVGAAESDSVEDAWLSSLDRSVVLTFRKVTNFTLTVQAVPKPKGQILQFAGWSELVDMGARVLTPLPVSASGAPTSARTSVVIRDALTTNEVTASYSVLPERSNNALRRAGRTLHLAPASLLAGACALAALVGSAVVLQQRCRERP